MRPRLSLKGRALALLAQREHSRSELRRKLLRHARAEDAQAVPDDASAAPGSRDMLAGAADRSADTDTEPGEDAATPTIPAAQRVDALLDWLEQQRYLSEVRFVESRIHARATRFGNLRIRQELAEHGVELPAEAAQALQETELARAREVWLRKFGTPAASAAELAKQMRFLAGRGFSPDVIRRVLRS